MRHHHALALACAALLASGCGGGSKDKLYVSVTWSDNSVDLYTPTTLQPTLSGFDGHEARCGLTTDTLPPGMGLNRDCTISGTPSKVGGYSFSFDISAEDTEGSVSSSGYIYVNGPTAFYAAQSGKVGVAYSRSPQFTNGWNVPPASLNPVWTWSVASGTLPPGLSLNTSTGVVSGTPTTAGSYTAIIHSVLQVGLSSYTLPNTVYAQAISP